MNDSEELGRLSSSPRDDQLQATDDRLRLPRRAFIALRQSGGLRFSTREVTVYNDGRVTWQRQGKLDAEEGSRRITPDEVVEIKDLIAHSGLWKFSNPIGQPSPDGYTYELIARFERKSKLIEFYDGSIPAEIRPLLAQLTALIVDNTQE